MEDRSSFLIVCGDSIRRLTVFFYFVKAGGLTELNFTLTLEKIPTSRDGYHLLRLAGISIQFILKGYCFVYLVKLFIQANAAEGYHEQQDSQ